MKIECRLLKAAVLFFLGAGILCDPAGAVLQSSGNQSGASTLVSTDEKSDNSGTLSSSSGAGSAGKVTFRFVPRTTEKPEPTPEASKKSIFDDNSIFLDRDPRLVDPTVDPAFITKVVGEEAPRYITQTGRVVNSGNVKVTPASGSTLRFRSKSASASTAGS